MPWKVESHSGSCPESKPYAVVRADTGALVACHETGAQAAAHLRALYANAPEESES